MITIEPIGYLRSHCKYPQDRGPQAGEFIDEPDTIALRSDLNGEELLDGYRANDRIWLISNFHANNAWKAKVQPPRWQKKKLGVLATRSPHRPNMLGLTSALILEWNYNRLVISATDLLDGTPIIDIKPYLERSDSFPGCKPSWWQEHETYEVTFRPKADEQLRFLLDQGVSLRSAILSQLSTEPTRTDRKRIMQLDENEYLFCYRTWRARFVVDGDQVIILLVHSGYSESELREEADKYQDKGLHRLFTNTFD